jgi:hypothetical protein
MKETDKGLEMLGEIRDLLRLIAEPQLAERDRKLREELRRIAGKGEKNIKAVLLMDGSRNQTAIVKEASIDFGQLSKLVKALRTAKLLTDKENPELVIPITESVFQTK